jgi:hypothetical protein
MVCVCVCVYTINIATFIYVLNFSETKKNF